MTTYLARTVGVLAVVLFPLLANAQFTITPVVTTSTPVPGGTGTFKEFAAQPGTGLVAASIDGASFAFVGIDSANMGGIYRSDAGVISKIANFNTPIPNQSLQFESIGYGVIEGQQVAFKASSGNFSGIYLADGNQLTRVVDTTMTEPGSTA